VTPEGGGSAPTFEVTIPIARRPPNGTTTASPISTSPDILTEGIIEQKDPIFVSCPTVQPKFKITLKQFNNYKKLKTNNSLQLDLSDNDLWNIAHYELTKDQYNTLLRLDRMFNFHDRTIKEINEIILDWA
jgi:hypothetical protein